MARRTKEEAQETRHGILDAAEKVFHERGVSRTSLAEIAAAAGVTRGAIYWHFQDKADLFNAMMNRVTLPLEEAARRSDDPDGEPLSVMRANMADALHKTVHDPQVRRVFEIATHKVEYVEELKAVRDRHLALRNEFLQHAERGLELAMQRGQLSRRVPSRTAAFGLHAMVDGLIQNWILDPEAFDLIQVGDDAMNVFLTGLK